MKINPSGTITENAIAVVFIVLEYLLFNKRSLMKKLNNLNKYYA